MLNIGIKTDICDNLPDKFIRDPHTLPSIFAGGIT